MNEWRYVCDAILVNARSLLRCGLLAGAVASIGTNLYGYAYDTIGNRLWSAGNAATNAYSANCLNQYASILRASVSPCEPSYDLDGNLTGDGVFTYAYDAENRLVSVTSAAETNGAIRVLNTYDHRHRRIRKIVQRLSLSVSQPPAPPIETREWQTIATHTYVWDGNNIVLERIAFADGTLRLCEYFWGMDKSGTEQGAGGVGGLLAVSVNGAFFIPCYDHNGNIVRYVSENGSAAAQYTYDPYGNVIEASGALADEFPFGFSSKYHDWETELVSYQRRFYKPALGRWLNRDPIEEEGGENLYAFCRNNPVLFWDANGCWALIDNAIAAIGGALVGVGCQAISDLIMRETSDWESYVGAAVAGAVMGEILLHNPAMAGATKAIYGGTAAFVGNSVKQFCEVVVSKKQQTFNAQEMAVEVAAGATLAMAPFVKIPGVNRGKGSYLAVARRVNKQFLNRSIKRVSTMTTLRSFTGTAVEYGMAYGMAQPYVTDKVNRGISVFSDMITPADNEIQVIYSELIIIHVVDKCGNVVDVYYVREINSDGQ